jgi:3-hydroxyacyl-CoA dehydrogenase / 3-hydroxy-2-methylbutyryl-CoA dehydrogenase
MEISGKAMLVVGGASGLGAATSRALVAKGAVVTIADWNADLGAAVAEELGAEFVKADVREEDDVRAAVETAAAHEGGLRACVVCAGTGWPEKIASSKGPHQLLPFETVIAINLIGTFNAWRMAAAKMLENAPDEGGERGAMIGTASVAAFEGQVGQVAYSASKGGIVGMTLPAARDLAPKGIRVNTIAPGLFDTPLLGALPQEQRDALGKQVPFPPRLGDPAEYAQLAVSILENPMLNGTTIRLDGGIRMSPR